MTQIPSDLRDIKYAELTLAEAALILRKELLDRFPETRFTVKLHHFSLAEALLVQWVDGTSGTKIDSVLAKYKILNRDEHGIILAGNNRYAFSNRKISNRIRRDEEQRFIQEHGSYNRDDYAQTSEILRIIGFTDYRDGSWREG